MRLTKPGIVLSIIGVGAFAGFFLIQAFDSHKTTSNATNPLGAISSAPVPVDIPARNVPENLPPEIQKLNAVQNEIAGMTKEQLEKETELLKAKLKENDLLTRMKEKKLEGAEKEQAKEMLIRLSLIGVEKAKREIPQDKNEKKPPVQLQAMPTNTPPPKAQASADASDVNNHDGHDHGEDAH